MNREPRRPRGRTSSGPALRRSTGATVRRRGRTLLRVGAQRWLLLLVAVVGLIVAGTWYSGPAWRIAEVSVINRSAIPTDQIIGVSGLQDQHYQLVDLHAAAERIDDLPGVDGATVNCRWFGRAVCTIAVLPAPPLARWQSAVGSVWNDAEGKVQLALQPVDARLQIVVESGQLPPLGIDLEKPLLLALQESAAVEPPLRRLAWSAEYGLMYDDPGGFRVRLGVAERPGAIYEKLRRARLLVDTLATRGVRPRVVDVRFENAPFYSQ